MKASLYTRPDKPLMLPVTRRRSRAAAQAPAPLPQPVTVHGSTDCFVTPPDVAERMVDYAALQDGERVCDPEAGTGNLLQAVMECGQSVDLSAYELNIELVRHLQQRFNHQPRLTLAQGDFLEARPANIDCFVMNPPYSRRQAYHHVNHARQLLSKTGRIIALVPCTFDMEGIAELEALPAGTFSGTEVRTKIIEISA